jgi:hypothetical protein
MTKAIFVDLKIFDLIISTHYNLLFPLSGIRIGGRISGLGKVRPQLEHALACRLVLVRENALDGDDVELEQHEELVGVSDAVFGGEQVPSDPLTQILRRKKKKTRMS